MKPKDLDAGLIFSGISSGKKIKGFESPCSFTPSINSDYLYHESSRDVIVWFMNSADPFYLFGPAGSGKTSLIKQLAAKLNYPVFSVTGHSRLEFPDMVGHLTVDNGNMIFQHGPLALAMKYGGLFLIDEIDLLDPATAAGLNGILDGEPLCIPENGSEIINPHPLFRFAATANTMAVQMKPGFIRAHLDKILLLWTGSGSVKSIIQPQKLKKIFWLSRQRIYLKNCEKRWWNSPMRFVNYSWVKAATLTILSKLHFQPGPLYGGLI